MIKNSAKNWPKTAKKLTKNDQKVTKFQTFEGTHMHQYHTRVKPKLAPYQGQTSLLQCTILCMQRKGPRANCNCIGFKELRGAIEVGSENFLKPLQFKTFYLSFAFRAYSNY